MPDQPTTEFWKDLKPIENSFKPDAQQEVYLSQVGHRRRWWSRRTSWSGTWRIRA
ncbi:hypothetical protein AB0I53_13605 [Saccharopolyspora sp. NPDC050389]|uniref:hypothetical protein n=1 Tax=Saccharopolyspora sp. NPDC050389 TaxID=3155516 RepID=UPI0033E81593